MLRVRSALRFPETVNEHSARLVAAGVVVQAVLFLVFRQGWILVPLVYGFLARVVAGPTFSPLGRFVTTVITPRLRVTGRVVPGAPKRFAQAIGLLFSGSAAVAWFVGAPVVTYALTGGLVVAATAESALGVCVGCIVYRFFWECEDCDDITARLQAALSRNVPATN